MRFFAVLLVLVWTAHGQTTTAAKKKAPAATKAGASNAPRAAPRAAPKAGAKSTTAKSSTKSKRTPVARPPVQQQPTADRYKEIQQALADKGYFAGPVDGNWGPESVDALKRFQKDQNLDSDGKLGALSLMALGLGPKRGPSAGGNVAVPGAKTEPVDPPPVAQPETPEAPPAAQPEK